LQKIAPVSYDHFYALFLTSVTEYTFFICNFWVILYTKNKYALSNNNNEINYSNINYEYISSLSHIFHFLFSKEKTNTPPFHLFILAITQLKSVSQNESLIAK
jgi:hypothetical protein